MLEVLTDFVTELGRAGIAVSPQEVIDAAVATKAVGLEDRDELKSALSATLLKSAEHRQAFSTTFDVFFSRRADLGEDGVRFAAEEQAPGQFPGLRSGQREGTLDAHGVSDLVREALMSGDA